MDSHADFAGRKNWGGMSDDRLFKSQLRFVRTDEARHDKYGVAFFMNHRENSTQNLSELVRIISRTRLGFARWERVGKAALQGLFSMLLWGGTGLAKRAFKVAAVACGRDKV